MWLSVRERERREERSSFGSQQRLSLFWNENDFFAMQTKDTYFCRAICTWGHWWPWRCISAGMLMSVCVLTLIFKWPKNREHVSFITSFVRVMKITLWSTKTTIWKFHLFFFFWQLFESLKISKLEKQHQQQQAITILEIWIKKNTHTKKTIVWKFLAMSCNQHKEKSLTEILAWLTVIHGWVANRMVFRLNQLKPQLALCFDNSAGLLCVWFIWRIKTSTLIRCADYARALHSFINLTSVNDEYDDGDGCFSFWCCCCYFFCRRRFGVRIGNS